MRAELANELGLSGLRRLLPELGREGLSADRLCRLAARCARDEAALAATAEAAFASALGAGVLLSALSVAVVQGLLTLVGYLLGDLLDPAQVAALSATGGLVLLGVGLRLLLGLSLLLDRLEQFRAGQAAGVAEAPSP